MRFVLQLTVTVLISLSGCVLAAAETKDPSGSPWGVFSLPIAVFSLLFVDHWRLVRVPGWIATLLAMLAFYVAALEFLNGGLIESRLLASSHLIVYLTWLYLIQEKTARHYWWLHALAALQLAMASVLTAKPWFGVALLIAAFLGSWSLSLFLVARSVEPALGGTDWRELGEERRKKSLGAIRTGLTYDDGHRLINWRFVGNSLLLTVLGLVFSVAFFLFTPRIWLGPSAVAGEGNLSSTIGFSESVTLGDIGTSLQNEDPALEIKIFDMRENRYLNGEQTLVHLAERMQLVYPGTDQPYFRGAVLEVYSDGKWERSPDRRYSLPSYNELSQELRQVLRYRQDITLHELGSTLLFACGPVLTVEGDLVNPQRELWSDELQQTRKLSFRETDYKAYEIDADPRWIHMALGERFRGRYGEHVERLLLTPDNTDQIFELTKDLLNHRPPEMEAVRLVERYLSENADYTYSLNNTVQDRSIDPVEDFLFNRKSGHCEYYASAMALIMRKAGLPARVVTGFQGGAWDEHRQAYVVQQLHAHAWVEILINGEWIMADPTPPARLDAVKSKEGNAPETVGWDTKLSTLWSMSVQMTQDQQQSSVYAPFVSFAQGAAGGLPKPAEFIAQVQQFVRSPHQGMSEGSVVIAIILATMMVGAAWGVYVLLRKLLGWKRGQNLNEARIRVEFFERFLAILRRAGCQKYPTETAREFVVDAMDTLNPRLAAAGLASWPEELVTRFYDVRYGEKTVDEPELRKLESRLDELERCLRQREGHR